LIYLNCYTFILKIIHSHCALFECVGKTVLHDTYTRWKTCVRVVKDCVLINIHTYCSVKKASYAIQCRLPRNCGPGVTVVEEVL
jgi:hypothetical protein